MNKNSVFRLNNFEPVEEKIAFYKSEIKRAFCQYQEICEKGEEALHEIDKSRGVNWAKKVMKEGIIYFLDKLKEFMNEEEFLDYIKLNKKIIEEVEYEKDSNQDVL